MAIKLRKDRFWWLLPMVVAMGHLMAFFGFKSQVFYVYHRFVFPILRVTYDYSIGLLPFPSLWLIITILILLLIRNWRTYKYNRRHFSITSAVLYFLGSLTKFIIIVFSLFYFLWAFNYYRSPIFESSDDIQIQIDSIYLVTELNEAKDRMVYERSFIADNYTVLHLSHSYSDIENEVRKYQKQFLQNIGNSGKGRVRVRRLYPKGSLLRFSTAGIYIPFTMEGHFDPGMNSIQWPFTLAHEMAHGFGYTDEGECNFIGLMTCLNSENHFIRYSGSLGYWRYLYFEVRKRYPEAAAAHFDLLDEGIKIDLEAIQKDLNKYPDILPVVRDKIYDSYLKAHGVSSGLRSYNEVVVLMAKWNRFHKETKYK